MTPVQTSCRLADIRSMIASFVADSALNSLGLDTPEPAWDAPLVGICRGDDAIFQQIRDHIGSFYWVPEQAFAHAFAPVPAAELAVIAWVLPQTRATRTENATQTVYPSRRWTAARGPGERFNVALRNHVVAWFQDRGVPALAPMLIPQWSMQVAERWGFASTWSERHAAHACGLGTFGLCDGLITPLGKAIRVGSVIARLAVPPVERPYDNHRAWCLHFSHGTCRKCVPRCPVKALSAGGHDKERCDRHLTACLRHAREHYAFDGDESGCGMCQTGVPCEAGIPDPAQG